MADWVRCRSASEKEKVIWVNLDQVACMTEINLGTEITCAGGQTPIVVSDRPASILGHNIVRDA